MRSKYILLLMVIFLLTSGSYFAFSRLEQNGPAEAKTYLWNIIDTEIADVAISLPRQGKSQAFTKIAQGDKFPWYFDDLPKTPVDSNRWGGGIPLILSGPSVDRIIADDANAEQLSEYGLTQPSMEITITLTNHDTMKIEVGDSTPNGKNYYVRAPGSNAVATVDASWYQALAGLVSNPPYVSSTKK